MTDRVADSREFSLYLGLFESTAFWIRSNYPQVYLDQVILPMGPFQIWYKDPYCAVF